MFAFNGHQPMSMLEYTDNFLKDPVFDQALDIVPIVAATPSQGWPLWTHDTLYNKGLLGHLIRSLKSWSAFRGVSLDHLKMQKNLERHLPKFICDIQGRPQAHLHLSDVPCGEIESLAEYVEKRLSRFGRAVKEEESYVLPSKTAHLLLPTLIPAYDKAVIRQALLTLLRGASSMSSYMKIAWWVLQKFREEGTLQQARDHVAQSMLDAWLFRTLQPQNPAPDHWLLRSMDSVVAEYTIIQMGQREDANYLLRWA